MADAMMRVDKSFRDFLDDMKDDFSKKIDMPKRKITYNYLTRKLTENLRRKKVIEL